MAFEGVTMQELEQQLAEQSQARLALVQERLAAIEQGRFYRYKTLSEQIVAAAKAENALAAELAKRLTAMGGGCHQ